MSRVKESRFCFVMLRIDLPEFRLRIRSLCKKYFCTLLFTHIVLWMWRCNVGYAFILNWTPKSAWELPGRPFWVSRYIIDFELLTPHEFNIISNFKQCLIRHFKAHVIYSHINFVYHKKSLVFKIINLYLFFSQEMKELVKDTVAEELLEVVIVTTTAINTRIVVTTRLTFVEMNLFQKTRCSSHFQIHHFRSSQVRILFCGYWPHTQSQGRKCFHRCVTICLNLMLHQDRKE